MSFGDPNDNPYSQPPQQPPQQPPGYPSAPPNQPGYGYPQGPQNPPAYGYPQQPGYPGYPAAYPGANMMRQTMPGLMVTARVFLYIIAAVQVLIGIAMLYAAATVNDISDGGDDIFGDNVASDLGHDAAGILAVIAIVFLALTALSITLGVKFTNGGQGIRITTMIYGILGAVVGVLALINSHGTAVGLLSALLWIVFGGIIAASMMVEPSTAWFNRPRY